MRNPIAAIAAMLPIRSRRPSRTLMLAAALCLLAAASPGLAQEHTLYVAVADSDGNPVTGLTENDIAVQWDGENLETTRFEAVAWPVRLTVFVDNSGSGSSVVERREGLRVLLRELPAEIDVAFLTLARQPQWITRHTSDRAELEEGIANITPDFGTRPRFVDALVEETNRVVNDADREYYPVIIMVSGAVSDSSTSQQGRVDLMVEQMVNNSMEVHTLLDMPGGGGAAVNSNQLRIGQALMRITRGSFERVTENNPIVERLTVLARDIARKHRFVSNQYRITYRQPRNASPQPTINVVAARRGVQMMATLDGNIPARPPEQ